MAIETESGPRVICVTKNLLIKNSEAAARNRTLFRRLGVFVVNVLSSPGSGKTTLLRETLTRTTVKSAVVVGDPATDNDARRLHGTGAKIVQITTGSLCHLEADMIARAWSEIESDGVRLLFIENVGNLVCPAAYDLGEDLRVVLTSVTEGEDKPLKYPTTFKSADVVILSKTDLSAATGFDRAAALENLRTSAPQAKVLELSARTGDGMSAWCGLLDERIGRAIDS